MASAPFIIIGMHRSGTSLLAKVLERSGIFMGVVKDHNFEAMHFLSLNQQSLWSAGFDWHKPGVPSSEHWKLYPKNELYKEHFKLKGRWAYYRNLLKNPAWGFKDPRTTFTLEMWLSIYPNARVIYLSRNPEAIVKSLQMRNSRKGEVQVPELVSKDFCLELCEKYQSQAASYANALQGNYLQISYEELLARDEKSISALSKFCGKSVREALQYYLQA